MQQLIECLYIVHIPVQCITCYQEAEELVEIKKTELETQCRAKQWNNKINFLKVWRVWATHFDKMRVYTHFAVLIQTHSKPALVDILFSILDN